MDINHKKTLKQAYKDSPSTAGIFIITNNVSRKSILNASMNAQGTLNRHKFELKYLKHKNKNLQADWETYGEDGFSFSVLETIKPDEQNVQSALNTLIEKYKIEYQLNDENTY